MVEKYDHAFKLMLIGDSGVGKSQIFVRFTNDAFSSIFTPTIGKWFLYMVVRFYIVVL